MDEIKIIDKTINDIFQICQENDFPGTSKYPAYHPIWECRVGNNMSPKEAWYNDELLFKAILNLFKIYQWSKDNNKYQDFVKRIDRAFRNENLIMEEVVKRFTIAKIAPKVTALHWRTMLRILDESQVNLSNYKGVYVPMAGFGGIVKAIKAYSPNIDIEAYDINDNFCNYYGWIKRDVLAQVIKTDKIVIACPPFGAEYENWGQKSNLEPDSMYSFEEWCDLIMNHVKAPNYIFIGPSERNSEKSGKQNGLFAKKVGVKWYKEYTYDRK